MKIVNDNGKEFLEWEVDSVEIIPESVLNEIKIEVVPLDGPNPQVEKSINIPVWQSEINK